MEPPRKSVYFSIQQEVEAAEEIEAAEAKASSVDFLT
jgi:hypothetical protein